MKSMTNHESPSTSGVPADLAGRDFWNDLWGSKAAATREIGAPRLRHWEKQHADFMDRAFSTVGPTHGKEILEIGAGDSGWLAYFSKRWGLRVSGLDYSPHGCERASELLNRAGVQGNIVLADMFAPPADMLDRYDVVLSNGVIEHYSDTPGTVRALARFVRPGGILVTTVPNIPGLVGDLFKIMNRPVYDIHVPLDEPRLREAHAAAGLEIVSSGYLMSLNLGVPNVAGLPPSVATKIKSVLLMGMIAVSRVVWWFEDHLFRLPATRYFSPYVTVVARKPRP
jgi:2-polyprenyl-3-methyl-5-hydroxy-6-metoxy-1,4-benzoquinol methylase